MKPKEKTTCDAVISYKEEIINSELNKSLLDHVENSEFTDKNTIYYGEYSYKSGDITYPAQKLPKVLMELVEAVRPKLSNQNAPINSCIIRRYDDGTKGNSPQRMVEPIINPESLIVTVLLGTGMTISFRNDDGQHPIEMPLEDGSVLEMTRHSQDFWTHHMNQSNNGTVNYLFTFLHASPHFLQSTILLGDSNTARINFGSGKGTLGVWMPGKRVAAMFIEHIPDACNIGPYHNIILHTGINNIKNPYNRKSNAALISSLRSKCDDIAHTYPKARVFISLLLPTKSTSLNFQVRQFNNNLIDFAFVRKKCVYYRPSHFW